MNEVLIVDDSIMNRTVLTNILKDEYSIVSASSGREMFNVLEEISPKLILLDVIMPELDGFEVIAKLKASDEYNKIPVIFITGLDDAVSEEKGFSLGAIDYITKPFKANVVKARVKSYVQLYDFIRQTEMLGQNDGLTGLYNKKMTEQEIRKQLAGTHAIKCGALMIIDVDNFKSINDTFGHLYGDAVITQLGSSLRSIFQKSDILGRVGGDEFFVFMRNYKNIEVVKQRAKDVNDEFRKSYEQNGMTVNISASIGIATTENSTEFESIYKFADIALYSTKAGGKNGFTFFSGEEDFNYKSSRTEIENKKINHRDPNENINDFSNTLKEYMFNLVESSRVAEYTIQSILSMIKERFGFDRAYIAKLDYEEASVRCIYDWISSEPTDTPVAVQMSFAEITRLHDMLVAKNLVIYNAKNHDHIFSTRQDNNKTLVVFALMNRRALLGYIAFERAGSAEDINKDMEKGLVDTCQQLSTVVINQFLIDNINHQKNNLETVLNNLNEAVYVTKPEAKNPLFINNAAKQINMHFHGRDCFMPNSACEDCVLKAAISNSGNAEFNDYQCTEIDWSNGTKAYLIRKNG